MKAVVQRVSRASVIVDGQVIAAIGQGMLILVGAGIGDSDVQARALVDKIVHLRIYEDEGGKMNRSVLETGGEAIVVSQFTLYADTRKGRRPSFTDAAPPDTARPLVDTFAGLMRSAGVPTKTGAFGTHMLVELENDGPVTIILETPHGT